MDYQEYVSFETESNPMAFAEMLKEHMEAELMAELKFELELA